MNAFDFDRVEVPNAISIQLGKFNGKVIDTVITKLYKLLLN
jgi:hypothetical protein